MLVSAEEVYQSKQSISRYCFVFRHRLWRTICQKFSCSEITSWVSISNTFSKPTQRSTVIFFDKFTFVISKPELMLSSHKAFLSWSFQVQKLELWILFVVHRTLHPLCVDATQLVETEGVIFRRSLYIERYCLLNVLLHIKSFQMDYAEIEITRGDSFLGWAF